MKIETRHRNILKRISFTTTAMCLAVLLGVPVYAQSYNPSVQVDLSVIDSFIEKKDEQQETKTQATNRQIPPTEFSEPIHAIEQQSKNTRHKEEIDWHSYRQATPSVSKALEKPRAEPLQLVETPKTEDRQPPMPIEELYSEIFESEDIKTDPQVKPDSLQIERKPEKVVERIELPYTEDTYVSELREAKEKIKSSTPDQGKIVRIEPDNDKPVYFPVQTKTRSDSIDPGLVRKEIPSAQTRSQVEDALALLPLIEKAAPPEPERRPAKKIVRPVSEELVLYDNGMRQPPLEKITPKPERYAVRPSIRVIESQRLAGVPNMPSVPPTPVQSEIIPGSHDGKLQDGLADIDPKQVLNLVNVVQNRTSELLNTVKSYKPGQDITHNSHDDNVRIVRVPAEKLRPKPRGPDETFDITADELALIQPASGYQENPVRANYENTPREPLPGQRNIDISFIQNSTEIERDTADFLEQVVLPELKNTPSLRMQIQGFSAAPNNNTGEARRISLARALSVRSWLLDHGIEPRRLDIRAMGVPENTDNQNIVSLVLFDPKLVP